MPPGTAHLGHAIDNSVPPSTTDPSADAQWPWPHHSPLQDGDDLCLSILVGRDIGHSILARTPAFLGQLRLDFPAH